MPATRPAGAAPGDDEGRRVARANAGGGLDVARIAGQLLVALVGRRQGDVDEAVVRGSRGVILRVVGAQRSVLEQVLRRREVPGGKKQRLEILRGYQSV